MKTVHKYRLVLLFIIMIGFHFSGISQIRFDVDGISKWEVTEHSLVSKESSKSIFIGEFAGQNDDSSVKRSIAIGDDAMKNNTISLYNTAIGYSALREVGVGAISAINDGSYNVGLGFRAGEQINTGDKNTFIGSIAGTNTTTGRLNTAVGFGALFYNTTGNSNTVVGPALSSNTVGSNNVAFGNGALNGNIVGSGNTAIGRSALNVSTSSNNVALGYLAAQAQTTGSDNVAIGYQAQYSVTTGSNNISMGSFSGGSGSSSDNVAIGYRALDLASSGDNNVAIGPWANRNITIGDRNVGIGLNALANATVQNDLVAIGANSLRYMNSSTISNFMHLAIGSEASSNATTCYRTLAIGHEALSANNQSSNMAIGHQAMEVHNSGINNTAVGYRALASSTSGGGRTAVGHLAGQSSNHINATCVGYLATNTGDQQVRLGSGAVTSIGGSAAWTNTSDGRFKKNIREDVVGLDFINRLRPVTYNYDQHAMEDFMFLNHGVKDEMNHPKKYKSEGIVMSGFIAQEVEAAGEELGYDFYGVDKPDNEKDYYGLRYAMFTVPLVKSVQELSMQNSRLKEELAENSEQMTALKNEVEQLKSLTQQLVTLVENQ